jgi:hypothetical protein
MAQAFTERDGRYAASLRSGEYHAIALVQGFDDCWASHDQFDRWAPAAVRIRLTSGPMALDLRAR